MKRPLSILTLLAWALTLGLNATTVLAREPVRDHDRAHSAVRSGEVLPLRQILQSLRQRYKANVLDAQLRQEGGQDEWRYDVKLLDESGKVAHVTVDAKTGRVLAVR